MRWLSRSFCPLLIASLAVGAQAAGGGGAAKKGPKGIPFACSDARTLRVVYDGGGMRAKVKLLFDDGAAHELKAAPTPIGRRYVKTGEDGRLMIWTTDGVEAAIGDAPADGRFDDGLAGQREIARCHRVRGDGHSGAGHSESH